MVRQIQNQTVVEKDEGIYNLQHLSTDLFLYQRKIWSLKQCLPLYQWLQLKAPLKAMIHLHSYQYDEVWCTIILMRQQPLTALNSQRVILRRTYTAEGKLPQGKQTIWGKKKAFKQVKTLSATGSRNAPKAVPSCIWKKKTHTRI